MNYCRGAGKNSTTVHWFFRLFIFTMQNEHSVQIWSKTPWEDLVFWKMAKIAQNHHLKFSKIILLLKTDYLETMKWFCHKKPNHGCFRQLYAAFSEIFWKIWKNLKSANSLAVVTWAKFYSTHQTILGVCLICHRSRSKTQFCSGTENLCFGATVC